MELRTKHLITILILINFTLQLPCFGKYCLSCSLRSGECYQCSAKSYFKDISTDTSTNEPIFGSARTDPKCYTYTSTNSDVATGCFQWRYDPTTGVESCFRCLENYWRTFDGL